MEYRGKEETEIVRLKSAQVAAKLNLSAATLHLALRIVDLFMDGHDIQVCNHKDFNFEFSCSQEPQLYLVCLGALLLASKMEERQVLQNIVPALKVCFHSYFRDGTMPRCSQLNLFVKNYFPLADFLNLEFVMLAYFNWNLVRPLLIIHSCSPATYVS